MKEEIFTRDEAAAFLKVDKGTIAQWIKSGRLVLKFGVSRRLASCSTA